MMFIQNDSHGYGKNKVKSSGGNTGTAIGQSHNENPRAKLRAES